MLVPLNNWNTIDPLGKLQCIGKEPYPKIKKIDISKEQQKPVKPSFDTKQPLTMEYLNALKKYHKIV